MKTTELKDPVQLDLFDQPETKETAARYEYLFGSIDQRIIDQFKKFHAENPNVYDEFKKRAYEMKRAGRKFYSAAAIIWSLRYDFDLKTSGEPFKISNTLAVVYGRFLVYNEPEQFTGFFKFHKVFDRAAFYEIN